MTTEKDLQAAIRNLNAATAQAIQALKNITGQRVGRKSFDIPVTNIYDALKNSLTLPEAAARLGCSKSYIYKYVPDPRRYLRG